MPGLPHTMSDSDEEAQKQVLEAFGRITDSGIQLQFHIIEYLTVSDWWVILKHRKMISYYTAWFFCVYLLSSYLTQFILSSLFSSDLNLLKFAYLILILDHLLLNSQEISQYAMWELRGHNQIFVFCSGDGWWLNRCACFHTSLYQNGDDLPSATI